MKTYRIPSVIIGLFALITFSLTGTVLVQPHHGRGFWADLTDEQRGLIQAKISEMKDQGATREEIHEAIAELLEEFGIELPDPEDRPHGPFGHVLGPLWEDLTREQREAIRNKITEMREQGATHEEIHTAVIEMLEEFGIELPDKWDGLHGPFDPHLGPPWKDLTKEQQEAIRDKITEMRDQDATREEIHTAIGEMLQEFGIELTENWGKGHPGGPGFGDGFLSNLPEEQRETIHQTINEMRDEGATREEIHAAITELLEGFGIELPENWGEGPPHSPGFGPGPDRFLGDLTEEQRTVLQQKMREMREQGATREEIREAMADMLEEYGLEIPKEEEGVSSEARSVEESNDTSSDTILAEDHILAVNYPNPFNPDTHIFYMLHDPDMVRIDIYNITGQLIRSFEMGFQMAGGYSVYWDGCDTHGSQVSSGVYIYRIEAGPHSTMNRMMLLK